LSRRARLEEAEGAAEEAGAEEAEEVEETE